MVPIIYNAGQLLVKVVLSLDSFGLALRGGAFSQKTSGRLRVSKGRYAEGHGSRPLDLINITPFTVF